MAEFIIRSKQDPSYFNQVCWGDWGKPWEKQIEVWNSVRDYKRTTVRSGHSTGKSFIAAKQALWTMFCWPGSYVLTTAPTQRQVDLILWAEIRECYNRSRIQFPGHLLPKASNIDISDKWKVFGFTTGKGNITDVSQTPMAGYHSNVRVFVIIDEASGVAPGLFAAAESITTGDNDRILAIGNPTDPKGEFAKSFTLPAGNLLGGWNKIKISTLDSPNVVAGREVMPGLASATWPEEMRVAWGEGSPMYRAKVLAEFPEEGADTLIPLKYIDLALERKPEDIITDTPYNNLGVDVARFGDDLSVGYHCLGPRAVRRFKVAKQDTVQVSRKVNELNTEWAFKTINVDDDGIGGAVTDNLRRECHLRNVITINGNGKPIQPLKFFNKRSELAWQLRDRFVNKQDIILDCADTGAQLCAYEYDFPTKGGHGVYKLVDKKLIKKKLGRSPDDADALIYASADGRGRIVDASSVISFI